MPLSVQTDAQSVREILDVILSISYPPVARCRLLSSGFSPYHTLDIEEDVSGTKACLACGNCIDVCSILTREPNRQEKTEQRTSMALEYLVGEDCDRCYECILACPQVDTTIKRYVVQNRLVEGLDELLTKVGSEEDYYFDQMLEELSYG